MTKSSNEQTLLKFLNRPDLSSSLIDKAFEQEGRDLGKAVGDEILKYKQELLQTQARGFDSLEDVLAVPQLGEGRLKQMLKSAESGALDGPIISNEEQSTVYPRRKETLLNLGTLSEDEIRLAIFEDFLIKNKYGEYEEDSGDILNLLSGPGSPPPPPPAGGGVVGPLVMEGVKGVIGGAGGKVGEMIVGGIGGGDDDDDDDDDGITETLPCPSLYTSDISASALDKEAFLGSVTEEEKAMYAPIQKGNALKEAKEKLSKKLESMRRFQCAGECAKVFNVLEKKPKFEEFVWEGLLRTFVTWKCTIEATVTRGCTIFDDKSLD